MNTELLDAEEVVSCRDLRGNVDRVGAFLVLVKDVLFVYGEVTYCSGPKWPSHR